MYVLGLFEFKIEEIKFTVTQISQLESLNEYFIATPRTTKYYNFVNNVYTIDEDYKDSRLRGSSMTINDLIYEPNIDSHRLFMRNNCVYNSSYRGKLFYRRLRANLDEDKRDWDAWTDNSTEYYNNLFIYTGPCYITDNL